MYLSHSKTNQRQHGNMLHAKHVSLCPNRTDSLGRAEQNRAEQRTERAERMSESATQKMINGGIVYFGNTTHGTVQDVCIEAR